MDPGLSDMIALPVHNQNAGVACWHLTEGYIQILITSAQKVHNVIPNQIQLLVKS